MFRLVKHYFDGIDNTGNTIIIYAAQLNFFGIKIPFSSYILHEKCGAITEEGRLTKADLNFEDTINIKIKSLNITGQWKTKTRAIKEVLYQRENKQLMWDCHTPNADFTISTGNKHFSGVGYCETLHLPFYPWQLPIQTLKWGRYLSESTTIVWIEWIGQHPLKKIFWNGELCNDAEIEDDKIVFKTKKAMLVFDERTIIRNNPLAASANRHPVFKIIFPAGFLKTQEIKYTATAKLFMNGEVKDEGRALFETVKWKK